MKEVKKLTLSKFNCELKKGQMNCISGGATTISHGYETRESKLDADSSTGDWDSKIIISPDRW